MSKATLRKKIISLLILLTFFTICVTPISVSALESNDNNVTNHDTEIMRTDGVTGWEIASKSNAGVTYGSWRRGPEGKGPGTLELNQSYGITNTITGTYSSKSAIEAALGVSIGVSISHSTSFSIDVPKGETWLIKFRAKYDTYLIREREYRFTDGHKTYTGKTKSCTVCVFTDWGYESERIS